MYPDNLKYSEEHEWLKLEDGNKARVGITAFAQQELGDVVFVELPEDGLEVEAGGNMAVVESVKAVSDIYAPIAGKVVAINEALEDKPELINEDPYGEGWIAVIEITDSSGLEALLSAAQYEELVAD